ncbi:MAG: hypothetical protein LBL75_04250 [Rickettsiales bacterium]|jgi:hypothetical protein|nr:hypothetical protein [Rickettsiales bacterium]
MKEKLDNTAYILRFNSKNPEWNKKSVAIERGVKKNLQLPYCILTEKTKNKTPEKSGYDDRFRKIITYYVYEHTKVSFLDFLSQIESLTEKYYKKR